MRTDMATIAVNSAKLTTEVTAKRRQWNEQVVDTHLLLMPAIAAGARRLFCGNSVPMGSPWGPGDVCPTLPLHPVNHPALVLTDSDGLLPSDSRYSSAAEERFILPLNEENRSWTRFVHEGWSYNRKHDQATRSACAWLGNQGGFGKIVSGPSRTDFSTPSSMKVLWTKPIPLCASASLLPGH